MNGSDSGKEKKRIMIVDDNVTNLMFAKTSLSDIYDVFTVPSAAKLFALLPDISPHLILLDVTMPEMDGYEAIKILKSDSRWEEIPVIFLTASSSGKDYSEGLTLGAEDFIYKPFQPELMLKRVENLLELAEAKKSIKRQKELLGEAKHSYQPIPQDDTSRKLAIGFLSTLSDYLENRGMGPVLLAGRTEKRLAFLVKGLIQKHHYESTLDSWDLSLAGFAAELHDLGKVFVPDSILLKRGRLTAEEFDQMKLHTTMGAGLIDRSALQSEAEGSEFWRYARLFALYHHEKWDGTGYPDGRKDNDIPLEGRLMALINVYDALVSVRPYKKAFPHDYAVRIILEGRGSHFDPKIVDVFKEVSEKFQNSDIE
ncbi:MAG: response regulator [Deltaproteobacteria bacterium]|jgi:putative two-component system response regulator|nr:response regulator [Deltaproteobacteria bacterium]